ncbi:glycoside hydrolase family 16 protein [Aquabacterium sp. OR-4]|uniref:glycoside hydrolase family 16 protein n=1 Tax=Aquabacterium sp. OR-4 TaxID=2978127 RepID=UPI0021B29356|nr:glycoside hydrolase family 16 protein [Aquabacterium sp. OR-4]MDT7838135.1 glycoside hydrolase family 16 protein [Aquabacterium sp. OR-4]
MPTARPGPNRSPLMAALLALGALAACGGGTATAADAVAAGTPAATDAALAEPLRPPAGHSLVWADEFDRDGLPDPRRWAYDTGMNKQGWHNREQQYYSGPRADNAEVRAGRLVITARLEERRDQADWGGQRYSSTRLVTLGRQDWTYGFFEVRAKLPCGLGTWPAIWMLNSALDWPAGGELDIMEQVGREPAKVFSTIHTAAGHGGNGSGNAIQVPDACSAFHNYQMLWTPTELRFGMDGKTHHIVRNDGSGRARWPFDRPQFLILNIAVGGDLGGPVDDRAFPVRFEIEHVRVYQAPR